MEWYAVTEQTICSHCGRLISSIAMITATPYFLSQLEGSPLQHTFPSYMSLTFTASNVGFLAHATATAKQVWAGEYDFSVTDCRIVISFSESVSRSHHNGNCGISAHSQHVYAPACGPFLLLRASDSDRVCCRRLILPNSYRCSRWGRFITVRQSQGLIMC